MFSLILKSDLHLLQSQFRWSKTCIDNVLKLQGWTDWQYLQSLK